MSINEKLANVVNRYDELEAADLGARHCRRRFGQNE